jgi:predicted ArsR family transcriptional regulator
VTDDDPRLTSALDDAALLAEPARRRLYQYVVRTGEAGREDAARATKLDRALAAFHLDKLVDAGFLEVTFRRLSGRAGPGAGRPSKLYRRAAKRLEVSVPATQYELLARLFARAVVRGGASAARELALAARDLGQTLGEEARRIAGRRPTATKLVRAAERTLARHGYEPRREGSGLIRLANCPFDRLATDYRDVVCGMNHAVMTSFVDELGARGLSAHADPRPGLCCVALRIASEKARPDR